jgi:hypothetical protein
MGDFTEKLVARIRDRIENELDAIGVEVTAEVRQAISTPVVRVGRTVVQRSSPGNDPWLETGHLWRSQNHTITSGERSVTLNIGNAAHYARALNDGHEWNDTFVEARPFWSHVTEAIPRMPQRVADAIFGKR